MMMMMMMHGFLPALPPSILFMHIFFSGSRVMITQPQDLWVAANNCWNNGCYKKHCGVSLHSLKYKAFKGRSYIYLKYVHISGCFESVIRKVNLHLDSKSVGLHTKYLSLFILQRNIWRMLLGSANQETFIYKASSVLNYICVMCSPFSFPVFIFFFSYV